MDRSPDAGRPVVEHALNVGEGEVVPVFRTGHQGVYSQILKCAWP